MTSTEGDVRVMAHFWNPFMLLFVPPGLLLSDIAVELIGLEQGSVSYC
jgi:hypothetical protein